MYIENLKATTKRIEIKCVTYQLVYEGKEQNKENYINPVETANKGEKRSKPKIS